MSYAPRPKDRGRTTFAEGRTDSPGTDPSSHEANLSYNPDVTSVPIPLAYGRNNPLRRRVRKAVLCCISALVLLLAYEPASWGVDNLKRWEQLHGERQDAMKRCLEYRLPSTVMIFDESHSQPAYAAWVRDFVPDGLWRLRSADAKLCTPRGATMIRCASCLRQIIPPVTLHGNPPASDYSDVIFLGGRRAPGGPERLTVVMFDGPAFAWADAPPITVCVYRTSGLRGSWLRRTQRLVDLPLHRRPEPLRVYAGQPDPHDPSHFTIPIAFGARAQTIDGWLRADDRVTLRVPAGH